MGWTERFETNGGVSGTGIQTWDSYSTPSGFGQYTADLSWPGGSPAEQFGVIIALPNIGTRASLVQTTGSSGSNNSGFSTFSVNLDKRTTPGSVIIVDIVFNSATIVSGIRVSDNGNPENFYWPQYCARSAGGAAHIACFMAVQGKPSPFGWTADQINITQGSGAGSPLTDISVIVSEYAGLDPFCVQGSYTALGLSNTLINAKLIQPPPPPGQAQVLFPRWIDTCYVFVSGNAIIPPGVYECGLDGLDHRVIILNGAATPFMLGQSNVQAVNPPDNMGGFFMDFPFTGGSGNTVLLEFQQAESQSSMTVTVSNVLPHNGEQGESWMLHLVAGSYSFFPTASPPPGGGESGCSPAWLEINEPFGGSGISYPTFIPRVFAHDFDGVWTYDAIVAKAGPNSFDASLAWASGSQDTLSALVSLTPSGSTAPLFIQGAGAASASGVNVDTFSISFTAPVTSGNCIVVDVFMLNVNPDTFRVTDTQSNSYTEIYFEQTGAFFGGDCWATFVALGVVGGSVTITVDILPPTNPTDIQDWAVAIHEYSGVLSVESFTTGRTLASGSPAAVSLQLSPTVTKELLHAVVFAHQYNATVTTLTSAPSNAWIDQSIRISQTEPISFSWIVKQRGSAKIPLYIPASDSYMPTIGSQVCLWDLTDEGDFEVFSGTIDDFNVRWLGQNGDRIVTLTCVSLEQCFDTIRLPNLLFENTTAGAIFTALLAYASGAPVGTGTIDAGADIANFLITDFPSISDVFGRLATLSAYVWGVDPGTGNVYFTAPNITPAPFIVSENDVLWEQMTLKEERHDFRNRQILKANANAAVQSSEYFVGVGQLNFTLLRPVDQVTAAWITQNIQNSATGTFSGQPNAGDTISFGYANSGGSGYTWLPSHTYAVGDIIIDPAGYVQKVTAQTGPTGGSEPTWLDIYGKVTIDHDVAWTNQGPAGFGSNIAAIYTFVTALDNTQFGQVLIGSDVAHTAQNLVDAINAIAAQSGVTFSLPTWENPIVNADEPAGLTTIVVRNKAAGAGFVAGLSWTGTHFSFNRSTTFGGVTTFGTITVNVGVQGQTIGGSGPTLVYTPGSADVSLATPLNSGSNLQVQYAAANAAYIIVEDTADVLERAVIDGGTGKYQQTSSDDSAVTMPAGLQLAQQQLAAYGVIPSTFEFTTFQAGLYTGQVLDVVLEIGAGDLVNTTLSPLSGQWFIEEINAESLPMYREEAGTPVYLPGPTGGHYRYTVRCIDVAQIGSWIDFWLGLSGGGGSASGSALFPGGGSIGGGSTSNLYSAAFTCVAGTPLAITHGLNTTAIITQAYDSSGNLAGFGSLVVTDANTITVTFGIGFTGKIVVLG